jgi:hypothetical protein
VAASESYEDAEGNVLELRERLSAGTVRQVMSLESAPAASADDLWRRRSELLFERLAVSWTVSGLPLNGQGELLGRYRMAAAEERRWVRETVWRHARERHPELAG